MPCIGIFTKTGVLSFLCSQPIGLFRNGDSNSKWFLLRHTTLIPHPLVYHVAIVNNALLRCAWIAKILCVFHLLPFHFQMKRMNPDLLQLVFGCIEVIRRNIWNIFRMENEQVNNCGKFRYSTLSWFMA